jgi:hypothetical protein
MTRYVVVILLNSALTLAQERFGAENERLKGFTTSPTEHIMNERPGVISVRVAQGRITEAASKTGVPGAVVEVRKADPRAKVQNATSNEHGRFRLRKLSEGEYVFKVTRDGFQSVFGRLRVSKHAPSDGRFDIELKQGV